MFEWRSIQPNFNLELTVALRVCVRLKPKVLMLWVIFMTNSELDQGYNSHSISNN